MADLMGATPMVCEVARARKLELALRLAPIFMKWATS